MKLDCVLTAVNENKLYLDFIPIFIKTWNKLYPDIDVKIILIANAIPEDFLLYKDNIIIFKPIDNISTAFISQFIRLLFPCILNYKNGIMITDIDMLPMNKTYYTDNIKSYPDNKFIYYRGDTCLEDWQIAMCYNVATSKIWSDIFTIYSLDDIKERIISVNNLIDYVDGHGESGWSTDQNYLYNKVFEWDTNTHNFIRLNENETQFRRLDRGNFSTSLPIGKDNPSFLKEIVSGKFSDYHCYRPMNKWGELNYEIYNLLE